MPLTKVNGQMLDGAITADSSGNVGIGTSSPSFRFQVTAPVVNNGISVAQLITNSGTGNAGSAIGLGYNTGNGYYAQLSGVYDGTGSAFTVSTSALGVAAAERMRIDSSGSLLIGTTSSPSSAMKIYTSDGTINSFYGYKAGGVEYIGTYSNHPLGFATNNTERMRITSGGAVNINYTAADDVALNINGFNSLLGTAQIIPNAAKGSNISHIHYGSTGDWYIRPASNSGSVYVKNYVAESDVRLKTNIEPIHYGLNDILALQPKKFNWIDGGDVENNGFIAQEVEAVLPALVSEGQWKSVDYQGITAILVKAIQELKAELDATKAEVAELKAKGQ